MSALLWTYYLQDDVESFQQLLAEAGVQGRTNAQKGGSIGQNTALGFNVVGDAQQAFSPPSQARSRTDGFTPSTPQLTSFRDVTLGKANVNKRDGKGLTILHHAASSTSSTAQAFAQALLAHPHIDLYVQDLENGWTALHRAFYMGNIAIARAIIERESQIALGQGAAGSVANSLNLRKVKDKEGLGPYDLYAATIHDRTLHHGEHNGDGLESSRILDHSDGEDANGMSDDESEPHLMGLIRAQSDLQGDELYTFGSNRNITLGFGDEDDRHRPERVKIKRPDHLYKRFYREHFERRSEDVSKTNPIYGEKLFAQAKLPKLIQELPSVVRSRPMTIQDVQMAKFHTAVVTNDPVSNLFVCGHGLGGRLGTGSEKSQFNLVCLEDFGSQRKKIVAVALGQDHTLAVTDQGELFTWGSNIYGQLGCGLPKAKTKAEDMVQLLPKQLFGTLKREIVIGVAASAIHSVVHTATAVYTFGKNAGQLGLVDSGARSLEAQGTPRNVTPSRFSSSIRSVSAIDKATICLLDSHEVFVFANFGCTRLDFPLDRFNNFFLKNSFLTTKYDDGPRRICKITSGGDTICALSTAGEVYTVTVKQSIDPSSANTTSTTNPNKIKAGISAPACVWSLKKDAMAARDVGVDQDGSVIISTEAGSVWRRILRPKAPNPNVITSTQKAKDFKFSRVPNLTRAVAVRASGAGAYCAIRQECDVTKTQIIVRKTTLWDDLFSMLSFRKIAKVASGKAQLESLVDHLRHSADLEKEFNDLFSGGESQNQGSYDLLIGTTTSELKIPAHKFVVAGRSTTFRMALPSYKSEGALNTEFYSLLSTHDGRTELRFHGIDFLTLLEMVLYLYTDKFIGFWNLTRQVPHMAFRYRQVRNELMKTAARLELRNLETAARRMSPTGDLCLNTDMELAVSDSIFFQTGDAMIQLADAEVLIHSEMLAQRCPFFEGLFRGRAEGRWLAARRGLLAEADEAIEIDLKHIELSIFKLVLQYLYADSGPELFDGTVAQDLEEFLDIVMEVLSVANELMLDRLAEVCQHVLGRHVTTRNICQLLTAVAPCSVTSFKDVGLEYLCLNLEAVMSNNWLDELDEDLLLELDAKVRENQLDFLPIAKSGRAEADLFEKCPELAASIDRARQAKLDALSLQSKFVDQSIPLGTSFEVYDEDWLSTTPARPRRSRHSRGSSASTTPKLKAKAKALQADIDDDFAEGLPSALLSGANSSLPSPSFQAYTSSVMDKRRPSDAQSPSVRITESRASPSPFGTPLPQSLAQVSQLSSSVGNGGQQSPPHPWAATSLPTAKLGIKEIMNQAANTTTSNISLGLRRTSEVPVSSPLTPAKMSQKERKKQQRQQMESFEVTEQEGSSSKSPWQRVPSYSKPVLPSLSPGIASGPKPGEQTRSASTPQLTMRQTIANVSTTRQSPKSSAARPQNPAAARSPSLAPVQRPSPNSPSMVPSIGTQAVPIQSIRHVPKPRTEASPGSYMHQSLADIIQQEQAGKDAIKEALAKRSLQEIQQEQEFLEWWDHQSRATQAAQAAEQGESSGAASKAQGGTQRGRGGRRKRGGQSRKSTTADE